jgi:hypothetical protein
MHGSKNWEVYLVCEKAFKNVRNLYCARYSFCVKVNLYNNCLFDCYVSGLG